MMPEISFPKLLKKQQQRLQHIFLSGSMISVGSCVCQRQVIPYQIIILYSMGLK